MVAQMPTLESFLRGSFRFAEAFVPCHFDDFGRAYTLDDIAVRHIAGLANQHISDEVSERESGIGMFGGSWNHV